MEEFDPQRGVLFGEPIGPLVIELYRKKVAPRMDRVLNIENLDNDSTSPGRGVYGRTDWPSRTIYLKTGLLQAQRDHNFAHELMHVAMNVDGRFSKQRDLVWANWDPHGEIWKLVWRAICEGYIGRTLASEGFYAETPHRRH